MSAIAITAANVAVSPAAVKTTGIAGVAITAGQAVYQDANGVFQLTNAATSAVVAQVQGIALDNAAAGQPLVVVTSDPKFTHGGTTAAGDTIWTSSTSGGITKTQGDLVTGVFTAVLGVAINATQMNLAIIAPGVAHA